MLGNESRHTYNMNESRDTHDMNESRHTYNMNESRETRDMNESRHVGERVASHITKAHILTRFVCVHVCVWMFVGMWMRGGVWVCAWTCLQWCRGIRTHVEGARHGGVPRYHDICVLYQIRIHMLCFQVHVCSCHESLFSCASDNRRAKHV